eukprot:9017771-Lingulodinium_polyedra.AAC.1
MQSTCPSPAAHRVSPHRTRALLCRAGREHLRQDLPGAEAGAPLAGLEGGRPHAAPLPLLLGAGQ